MSNETVTYSLDVVLKEIKDSVRRENRRHRQSAKISGRNPKKSGLDIDYPFGKCHYYGRLESIFFQ